MLFMLKVQRKTKMHFVIPLEQYAYLLRFLCFCFFKCCHRVFMCAWFTVCNRMLGSSSAITFLSPESLYPQETKSQRPQDPRKAPGGKCRDKGTFLSDVESVHFAFTLRKFNFLIAFHFSSELDKGNRVDKCYHR